MVTLKRRGILFHLLTSNRQPVQLLFNDCLFEIPTKEKIDGALRPPKCKLESSRAAAFDLLYEMVDGSPQNYAELMDLLKIQLDRGKSLIFSWPWLAGER